MFSCMRYVPGDSGGFFDIVDRMRCGAGGRVGPAPPPRRCAGAGAQQSALW
jgi:hypothetical protein